MNRQDRRGLTAPSGNALLSAILDGAHEAKTMRDGTVVVAFALDPDTAEALFAFGSDDREDDSTAEDDDAEADSQSL